MRRCGGLLASGPLLSCVAATARPCPARSRPPKTSTSRWSPRAPTPSCSSARSRAWRRPTTRTRRRTPRANDLRNKAAALGASLVTIDENVGEIAAAPGQDQGQAGRARVQVGRLSSAARLPSRPCPRRMAPTQTATAGSSRSTRSRSAAAATIRASSAARRRAWRGSCATVRRARRRRPARPPRSRTPSGSSRRAASRASLLRAASGRAGYVRAAEARQQILQAPLPRGLDEELARALARRRRRARRGASRCARARRARTARSSRWRAWPRASSACAAPEALADAVRAGVGVDRERPRARVPRRARRARRRHGAWSSSAWSRPRAAGVMFTRAPGARARRRDERIINVGPRPRRAGRQRRHDARRAAHRRARAARRFAHRPQDPGHRRRRDGRIERSTSPSPDRPALDADEHRAARARSRRASRSSSAARGTWSSRATPSGPGSCRRAPPRASASRKAATTTRSGATSTSARRCPASRRPSPGRSPAPSARPGSAARSPRSGARVPKHARLVGNVHGRFYLNLTQFMRIAAQVPFLDPRTLVELGGGWGGDELAVQVAGRQPARLLRAPPADGVAPPSRAAPARRRRRGASRRSPRSSGARRARSISPSSPTRASRGACATSRRCSSERAR